MLKATYRPKGWGRAVRAVAAVLLAAGCTSIEGRFVPYDSFAQHVQQAAAALSAATGVQVGGTVQDAAGRTLGLDVRLNGGGDGTGTVRRNGVTAAVLVVDGVSYVRADTGWWAPDIRAETYRNSWVKVSAGTLGLDLAATLRPQLLGTTLMGVFGDLPIDRRPPVSPVGGVPAQKITSAEGDLWISATAPYRVVQVAGRLFTNGDDRRATFAVAPTPAGTTALTSRDVAQLLPQLRTGSYDAQRGLQFDGRLQSACDALGCTVTGRIRNVSADATVAVELNGKVTSGRTLLGRCRSGRATLPASGVAALTCRIVSATWQTFYRNATTPGAGTATTRYQVGANATAVGPAPASVSCLPGATGCHAPTTSDRTIDATFARSARHWFDRPTTAGDRASWQALIRDTAKSGLRVPWSNGSTATVAYLSNQDGRAFVAQFARSDGRLVVAYGVGSGEAAALRSVTAG